MTFDGQMIKWIEKKRKGQNGSTYVTIYIERLGS